MSSEDIEAAIAAVREVTVSIGETKADIEKMTGRVVAMHKLIDVLANMVTLLLGLVNPSLITEEARVSYAQLSQEATALSAKVYGVRPTISAGVKI